MQEASKPIVPIQKNYMNEKYWAESLTKSVKQIIQYISKTVLLKYQSIIQRQHAVGQKKN